MKSHFRAQFSNCTNNLLDVIMVKVAHHSGFQGTIPFRQKTFPQKKMMIQNRVRHSTTATSMRTYFWQYNVTWKKIRICITSYVRCIAFEDFNCTISLFAAVAVAHTLIMRYGRNERNTSNKFTQDPGCHLNRIYLILKIFSSLN